MLFIQRTIKPYLFFCCLVAWLALPMNAHAAGEALVNSEAIVDVTGKDAADARAQAHTQGQYDALVTLLSKLTTPEQMQTILTGLDAEKIAALVRGMEILDERMSSNRYRARLIISFDGNAISKIVGSRKVDGSGEIQQVTGSFLIIPSYEETGTFMLWEDKNSWRTTWKSVALEVPAGDIIVPYGDNSDMAVISDENVSSITFDALVPLTVRYGTSDVVVLHAKFIPSPDMVLHVTKRRINATRTEVNLLTYRADPQETKAMLFTRAARDIANNMQSKKNEEIENVKLVTGGDRNKIMLLASVSTLQSWTHIRSKLSELPMIDDIEMLAISPNQVDVVLHYRGSEESLANGITAQNLRLIRNKDYWVVSRD